MELLEEIIIYERKNKIIFFLYGLSHTKNIEIGNEYEDTKRGSNFYVTMGEAPQESCGDIDGFKESQFSADELLIFSWITSSSISCFILH